MVKDLIGQDAGHPVTYELVTTSMADAGQCVPFYFSLINKNLVYAVTLLPPCKCSRT
jgi:hypothetical protein